MPSRISTPYRSRQRSKIGPGSGSPADTHRRRLLRSCGESSASMAASDVGTEKNSVGRSVSSRRYSVGAAGRSGFRTTDAPPYSGRYSELTSPYDRKIADDDRNTSSG